MDIKFPIHLELVGKRWRIWAHGKEQLFAKCAILTAPPSPPSPAPAAAPAVDMGQVLQNFTATVCAAYFKTHTMQRRKGSILDTEHCTSRDTASTAVCDQEHAPPRLHSALCKRAHKHFNTGVLLPLQ